MKPLPPPPPTAFHIMIRVRPEPAGKFTAQVVGLPDVQVTAHSREEAIKRLRLELCNLAISGELVSIDVPAANPLLRFVGSALDDPDYEEHLEDVRREREKLNVIPDYDEMDPPCSDISSTPTT